MKNEMAEEMIKRFVRRYEKDFEQQTPEKKEALLICYWVMSICETFIWESYLHSHLDAKLYYVEDHKKRRGLRFKIETYTDYKDRDYFYQFRYSSNVSKMLQKFVEIFNEYSYGYGTFWACGPINETIYIIVNMFPDAEEDIDHFYA